MRMRGPREVVSSISSEKGRQHISLLFYRVSRITEVERLACIATSRFSGVILDNGSPNPTDTAKIIRPY